MQGAVIRRLTPDHVADYRALMLGAYADESGAFTTTVAEGEERPLSAWTLRVAEGSDATERVFGAFVGGSLVGVVGLRLRRRTRTRHKATLFALFVRPENEGQGLGRRLVEAALEEARARNGVLLVQLTVTHTNHAARRLYESCGFRTFGTEPMANRLGDGFVDKIHMWRPME